MRNDQSRGIQRAGALMLVFVLVSLPMATARAQSNPPDPALSTVPEVLVTPGGVATYEVQVVGPLGPVNGDTVRVVFSPEADSIIRWCPGQVHPVLTDITGIDGVARFNIAAGGCVDPALALNPPPVQVFSGSTLLAEVGVVSPDYVDAQGIRSMQGWNPTLPWTAGISDFVVFTEAVTTSVYDYCADASGDGAINIIDAVIFFSSYSVGESCP